MPMPFLWISSSRLDKRLDRFERELSACHDRLDYLSEIVRKLGHINTNLLRIHERISEMQRAWDDLVADVAALKDLPASVDAGFDRLMARIEELLGQVSGAPTVAEVEQLGADIKQAVADVQAAIPANVP